MRKRKKEEDRSIIRTSLVTFMEAYNQNLPVSFPRASVAILKKFQGVYPALFKNGDMWSMAQHRKRVIDWLSVYRDIA
jgi:hypothetical protein